MISKDWRNTLSLFYCRHDPVQLLGMLHIIRQRGTDRLQNSRTRIEHFFYSHFAGSHCDVTESVLFDDGDVIFREIPAMEKR